MQKCTNCDSQNSDDAKFCSQCGTPLLADLAQGDSTATITFGVPSLETPRSGKPSMMRMLPQSMHCHRGMRSWLLPAGLERAVVIF